MAPCRARPLRKRTPNMMSRSESSNSVRSAPQVLRTVRSCSRDCSGSMQARLSTIGAAKYWGRVVKMRSNARAAALNYLNLFSI